MTTIKHSLKTTTILLSLLMAASPSMAHEAPQNNRPDDHAPIGVMRDHVHKAGEMMFSYRFSFMDMEGNRDGASSVSSAEVLQNYGVAPTKMPMSMHMFGGMVGVTDQLSIGAMGGYMTSEMDHTRRNGTQFTTESDKISRNSKVICGENEQLFYVN